MPLYLRPQWRLLAASAVAVPLTGSTSETALATISVPANLLGPNGRLRVTYVASNNNNGNSKYIRLRLGGIAGTLFMTSANTTSITMSGQVVIANRNAANSQVGFGGLFGGYGASGTAVVTAAIDTSAAVDLVLSGQLANSGDSLTLEHYSVKVLTP